MTKNNKDDKKPKKRMNKKNSGGAEKEKENVQPNTVECEIVDDKNLINLKNKTTLKNIIKEDGQIYAKTAPGQNRNLDTTDLVKVDEDWLPKLLNIKI